MSDTRYTTQEQYARWDEKLRCPACKLTGDVSLSQGESDYAPIILSMPAGFKVASTEYGPAFYCKHCNILVDP